MLFSKTNQRKAEQQAELEQKVQDFRLIVKLMELNLGKGHPHTSCAYYQLGKAYLAVSQYEEAFKALSTALSLVKDAPASPDIPSVGDVYAVMGDVFYRQKKYSMAVSYYRKALPGLEADYGPQDRATGEVYYHMADCCIQLEDVETAKEFYGKSYEAGFMPPGLLTSLLYRLCKTRDRAEERRDRAQDRRDHAEERRDRTEERRNCAQERRENAQ